MLFLTFCILDLEIKGLDFVLSIPQPQSILTNLMTVHVTGGKLVLSDFTLRSNCPSWFWKYLVFDDFAFRVKLFCERWRSRLLSFLLRVRLWHFGPFISNQSRTWLKKIDRDMRNKGKWDKERDIQVEYKLDYKEDVISLFFINFPLSRVSNCF